MSARVTSYLYRVSLRYDPASPPKMPDRVRTITYSTTYQAALAAARRMECKLFFHVQPSPVIQVEVMRVPAGLGAAEWIEVATVGGRIPGGVVELWRDGGDGFEAMRRNGAAWLAYEGPEVEV